MTLKVFLPPRIQSDEGEPVLLTDALEVLIEENGRSGRPEKANIKISLIGDLFREHIEYLADWFQTRYNINACRPGAKRDPDQRTILIYSTPRSGMPCFELAGWGVFEFIDYLRLRGFDYERIMKIVVTLDSGFAGGSPRIWAPVLEFLAQRIQHYELKSVPLTVIDLLTDLIKEELNNDFLQLNLFLDSLVASPNLIPRHIRHGELPESITHFLREEDALFPLLAKRIAERLRLGDTTVIESRSVIATGEWLESHLRGDNESQRYILEAYGFECGNVAPHWNLLLMCDPDWHPKSIDGINATCANLPYANWNELIANSAVLSRTNLEQASLKNAVLKNCHFNGVDFTSANLSSASLAKCNVRSSVLRFANLSHANIDGCAFTETQLEDACLANAMIKETGFHHCNLTGSDLTSVFAKSCDFRHAKLIQVQLDDAELDRCQLDNLDLRSVMLEGAKFRHCSLTTINLEDVRLDGEFSNCNFSKGLLTGSVAFQATLRDCDFSGTGLADIEWIGCDLRGSAFIGSAFHLGSTRCGTLDSPYPSHGTRTGYYTDDYEDLHFKNPEAIRKAALVDCDLRGAILNETDFYLVDLRGSQYDPCYEAHLRSCGAILDD